LIEQVLKEIQAEMSLDAVEELMAETQEAIAHQQVRVLVTSRLVELLACVPHIGTLMAQAQQEIENMLAGKLTDEDEDAILAELDELVQQVSLSLSLMATLYQHRHVCPLNCTSAD
jgi:hypothetical protein